MTMDEWKFRWLVVGPVGQDDVGLVLMPVPSAPMLDAESSRQLAELVAKGAGGTLFLETDDCQASYGELSARGVVFNDPPTSQPYGIDTSFRDPSGNNVRLTRCSSSRWIATETVGRRRPAIVRGSRRAAL